MGTTKDWPTPSPTVKPTSKFNLFTFPPLSCFSSLSHVAAFVALFITTSIIDKKKKNEHTIFEIFFFEQQHKTTTTQCMSLSTTINLGDFYQKPPPLSRC